MAQRLRWQLGGLIAGQIAYYVLLSYAWMLLGWNANFLGWIALVVACFVNPILCGYVANQSTAAPKKLHIVVTWLVLFCVVLACAPVSDALWLYASGFYHHALSNPNDYLNETIAWNEFSSAVGMIVCGIIFLVSFAFWRPNRTSQKASH